MASLHRGTPLRVAGHDAWAWTDGSPDDESKARHLTWSDGNVLLTMDADPGTADSELLKIAEALTPP